MPHSMNKDAIARSFSSAAETYNTFAGPQLKIVENLTKLLPRDREIHNILDIGCGTGLLINGLIEKYPKARLTGLDIAKGMVDYCGRVFKEYPNITFTIGDGENLKQDCQYDLITSSSSFQWFENLPATFSGITGHLRPQGRLGIAIIIEDSLHELKASYQAALGKNFEGLTFRPEQTYLSALKESGLSIVTKNTESFQVFYKNGIEAMKSFKGIGAVFNHSDEYRPLTMKELKDVTGYYEHTFKNKDNLVPVTYKNMYIIAEKGEL